MKIIINQKYVAALQVFEELLKKTNPGAICYTQSGRKFDRVFVGDVVRFFIQRTTGAIYGAKSQLAPNMRWWFDTIYNISHWDWTTGKYPTPKESAHVQLASEYGEYRHYIPMPPAEAKPTK